MAATELDPAEGRMGRERLFEERFYGRIFPNGDPSEYLPRFWMTRHVVQAARGTKQRAHAKWLVCHMLWEQIEIFLRSKNAKEAFWKGAEQGWGPELLNAADTWFWAVLRFYNAAKGRGEEATDASAFFIRRGLPKELKLHIEKSGVSLQSKLENRLRSFGWSLMLGWRSDLPKSLLVLSQYEK